ncbi:MAG: TetR/AcrR family transcriptional regulator [Clostridiales bacterium]|nr:TetR/AcrR family transcriptional regulator [Clostridiales bacterium]
MNKEKILRLNTSAILMTAEELFESQGFEATTMDEIALKTGVTKPTVYAYFKNKQLIWDSIVCKHMELLLNDAVKAAEGKESFEKRYYKLCFDIADKFEAHPMFYKATLGKISMDLDHEIYKKIYEIGEQTNEAIAAFIKSGIEEGVVRKDIDVYPAVLMMWSSISGIISMAVEKEEYLGMRFNMSKRAYLEKAFKMLLEGAL